MSKIGDLITVPDVKTVIQMSDLKDPQLRQFLTDSFLLTAEVRQVLESFFDSVCRGEGQGFWLEGNYGSGKSHLLAVISLLFSSRKSWEPLLEQDNTEKLRQYREQVAENGYNTINISLVEHSSEERLEEIIARALREVFPDFLPEQEEYRRKDFYNKYVQKIIGGQQINGQVYRGLVILIDELSEFLRSKPSGRSFNEDIRFLQFLGEFFYGQNCWLLATLQEAVEKTGEMTEVISGKIKDRYPVHFHLTGTHIQEIIAGRLIEKKPGAVSEIEKIYDHYRDAFSEWGVSREEFIKLYPINPLAVTLLDYLKPLFSEHRGIIDFIHFRLKGDDSRNIPSMMEQPAAELLNPDLIFDHFLDRLREKMETRRYYEKVFRYYQQELAAILSDEDLEMGIRIIKLLILLAISPVEKEYSVRDIVHMLLKPITDLDPAVNYEYVEDILQKMYRHGAYLTRSENKETADNVYAVSLEADVNLIIREKTGFIKSNFFEDDSRIFTRVGRLVEESYLPLAQLLETKKTIRNVNWQKTARSGYFCLLPLVDVTLKGIKEFSERLQKGILRENNALKDFVIIMGYPLQLEKQKQHLNEVIMPELDGEVRCGFCFWLPQPLTKEEKEHLQDILARILLQEEYEKKEGETAAAVREKLNSTIAEDVQKAAEIFRRSYFEGDLVDGNGEPVLNSQELAPASFKQLLTRITDSILAARYPDHVKIAPYQSVLNRGQLNRLCSHFLEQGVIEEKEARNYGILNLIEDVLKPLGIIKKRGQKIRLSIKPGKNPLLQNFFSLLTEEQTEIEQIFSVLRRGSYGLSAPHFKILVLALLFAGYITAYSHKKKISLTRLNVYNFERIKYIGRGELVEEEFQQVLQKCSIFPPRFREQPFSLPLQQEMWTFTTDWKRKKAAELRDLKTKIGNLVDENSDYPAGKKELLNNLKKVKNLLDEIMVSYSAEEGLERFAAHYQSSPQVDLYLERFAALKEFFDQEFDNYLNIVNYLQKMPRLPRQERYQELKSRCRQLQEALQDRDVIFSQDFWIGLKEEFADFREKYSEVYFAEHRRVLSGEKFAKFHRVEKSAAYRVLSYLASIEMISVKDDLIKVKRRLARVLRQECEQLKRGQLRRHPLCSCGFKPGESPEIGSVKEIYNLMGRGIAAYLQKLCGEEFGPRLQKYLENMEAAGEKRFARPLRQLLVAADSVAETTDRKVQKDGDNQQEQQISRETVSRLEELLNRKVIKRINRALAGSINLLERNLDQLYENLVGRSFSPDQIRSIFRDWLEGGRPLDKHCYIQVTGGDIVGDNEADNELLEEFLEEYYPELLSLYDRLEEEDFALFSAGCAWCELYGINKGKMAGLVEIKSELAERQNAGTHLELWQRVAADELFDCLRQHVDSQLKQDNLVRRLLELLPVEKTGQIVELLTTEFISEQLLRELVILLVKICQGSNSGNRPRQFRPLLQESSQNREDEIRQNYLQVAGYYARLQLSLFQLEGENYLKISGENKEEAVAENKSLSADEKQQAAEKLAQIEKLYIDELSLLEYKLARFEEGVKKVDLVSELPVRAMRKRVQRVVSRYNQQFSEKIKLLKESFPGPARVQEAASSYSVTADSKQSAENEDYLSTGITLSRLLLEEYPQMVKQVNASVSCCLLMDGMRQDTREVILKRLRNKLSLRIVREGVLISQIPTNTENQLEKLQEAGFDGSVLTPEEFNAEDKSDDLLNSLIKFSYIDDRVHTSKENYAGFMEEIIFRTENRLLPFLKRLPERSAVLLVSDHGYRLNYGFSRDKKYQQPRYLHGGETPFEVIVPWVFLYLV